MDQISHWRAGIDKPTAVLRLEPSELERMGLRFEDDYDDLDALRHACLDTPSGRRFALVRHRGAPQPGTEVVTREDSTTLKEDLEEVLKQLRLTRSDVVWQHPDIEAARLAAVLKQAHHRSLVAIVAAIVALGSSLRFFWSTIDVSRPWFIEVISLANLLALLVVILSDFWTYKGLNDLLQRRGRGEDAAKNQSQY